MVATITTKSDSSCQPGKTRVVVQSIGRSRSSSVFDGGICSSGTSSPLAGVRYWTRLWCPDDIEDLRRRNSGLNSKSWNYVANSVRRTTTSTPPA
jgi:hypothetical protein